MLRGRTDLQPELIRFVLALRPGASGAPALLLSRRCSTFADYLDAKAAALEAMPLVQVRPGTL
jgi:hypothetical protein